jgi:formylglycine-generating enzyme required for sulfatase activity
LTAIAHADPSGIGFGAGHGMNPRDALSAARASQAPDTQRIILAGYVDLSVGKPSQAVEWVSINGGKFTMGTNDGADLFSNAKPVREVTIKTFEMSKTLVTVEQYAECVVKGGCTEPAAGDYCNWGKAGRQRHPINCLDWEQANQFARFKEARLPTEAEWEYAATSGGKNQKYPWGGEAASCERAVMYGNGGYGCGSDGTMPVCSKPAGNAKFSSGGELCDAVGNVWQWVQDMYKDSYAEAPIDGSAVEGSDSFRLLRGGSFNNDLADFLRADYRNHDFPGARRGIIGFRLARSSR